MSLWMQVTGLRIIARNYDFEGSAPFKTEDIVGLTPLVSIALSFAFLSYFLLTLFTSIFLCFFFFFLSLLMSPYFTSPLILVFLFYYFSFRLFLFPFFPICSWSTYLLTLCIFRVPQFRWKRVNKQYRWLNYGRWWPPPVRILTKETSQLPSI